MLPHRGPFLMVDRILAVGPGARIATLKNLTLDLWCHAYSPGRGLFPNALMIEAMAQTAGALAVSLERSDSESAAAMSPAPATGMLVGIGHCRIIQCAKVGEQLILHAELLHTKGRFGRFNCEARVNGQRIGHAEVLLRHDGTAASGQARIDDAKDSVG